MSNENSLQQRVDAWFRQEGFTRITFAGPTERISTNAGEIIVHKLRERSGYSTFYKEATGGALVVFELAVKGGHIHYDGYCPLLLFGLWERKLRFKADAGPYTSYRHEGFIIEQRLRSFLNGLTR